MGDPRKPKGDLDWTELLADVRSENQNPAPKGWKTIREVARETGYSDAHTSKLLMKAVDEGKAEVKKFHIDQGYRYYPTRHFRML